jgi:hypothetical protein
MVTHRNASPSALYLFNRYLKSLARKGLGRREKQSSFKLSSKDCGVIAAIGLMVSVSTVTS